MTYNEERCLIDYFLFLLPKLKVKGISKLEHSELKSAALLGYEYARQTYELGLSEFNTYALECMKKAIYLLLKKESKRRRIESFLSLQTSYKTEEGSVEAEYYLRIDHESIEDKVIMKEFLEYLTGNQKIAALGYMNKLEENDIAELLNISLMSVESLNKKIREKWMEYEVGARIL